MEKMFAYCMSDKGLTSRLHQELLQVDGNKTNNRVNKWTKDLNRHGSKDDVQVANQSMRSRSASPLTV